MPFKNTDDLDQIFSRPHTDACLKWFNKLARALRTEDGTEKPKVLFILDEDFGELTTVLYLILGQPLFSASLILASPRVQNACSPILSDIMRPWHCAEDVFSELIIMQPDIVVLASGYLLPVHNLLNTEAIARLKSRCTEINARLVTADPFLGLITPNVSTGLEHVISIDIPDYGLQELKNIKELANTRLCKELTNAESLLGNGPHLYPCHLDMAGIESHPSDARNMGFFNPMLLMPPDLIKAIDGAQKRHWTFVLSKVDYQMQTMHVGIPEFIGNIARLLRQTRDLGRDAVFSGPDDVLHGLAEVLGDDMDGIHLCRFSSFSHFMTLLLASEYSFYWNIVSHSILIQLMNDRTVVLFDKGHLLRSAPALEPRIRNWYYQGDVQPYLDQNAPLSLDSLRGIPKNEGRARRFKRALPPQDLIERLIE